MNTPQQMLAIKHERKIKFFKQSDIVYCKHENKKTVIYFEDGSKAIATQLAMIKLFPLLDKTQFLDIYPSTIVNIDYVSEINNIGKGVYKVTLKDSRILPLAQKKRLALINLISSSVIYGSFHNLL
jgi:DNA-binding LytR/AlgR family response regulator